MISPSSVIQQAALLLDEIDALRPVIGTLSDDVLGAQLPPTERSVKEYYGAVVEITRRRAIPELSSTPADEDWPHPASLDLDQDWNLISIDVLLGELRQSREQFLEAVSDSDQDATPTVVQRLVHFDLLAQRLVAERLFDAQPPPRPDGKESL